MDFTLLCRRNSLPLPLEFSNSFHHSKLLFLCKPLPLHLKPKTRKNSHQKLILRASADTNSNGSDGFSWSEVSHSIRQGLGHSLSNFAGFMKKETGFDLEEVNVKVVGFVDRVKDTTKKGEVVLDRFRFEMVPAFVSWNAWEHWKDYKNWKPKRIAALILYIFVVGASFQRFYMAYNASRLNQSKRELTEAFMEALIPDPTPSNIRKFKKSIWRRAIPKGLKMKKFIEGPGGELMQDNSYVGEDAWDDDREPSQQNYEQIIDSDGRLNLKKRDELKNDFVIAGEESNKTWSERLVAWKEILRNENLAEQVDSLNAKYVVDFDMQEVEKSLRKDVVEKVANTQGGRALWISKRWWRYRPKLPYTYFLQKLDCSEVAAIVFTEDLKKLYVTMKEGFPLEYVVDIPLDPYLFEIISSSGVEVDLLQKKQIHYFLRLVVAMVPGLLIIYFIRESFILLHLTTKRYLYKRYKQLFDIAYSDNFIMPMGDVADIKSMHKDIILGGDVWDLLDELMIYMGNPMQYYERKVPFVRGVLLYGPPGTGKTLFARTLAKESGLPFVFASGAEFTDSEKSGSARLNEIFSIARRNAPSFIFVDEIDAIAGRYARKDPRRRGTFEALIAQLDGEKEKIGVDRFSLRQAVIFICATNRPDELDPEFLRAGRIDRRLYIGLPDAKQRVKIFGVHSSGKQLAEDVDFEKLAFRTVGYSGADVRSLVNEAGIMSVRKGHEKIFQQDIIDVLDKQLLEGMGVLITEEEQQKCEENVSFEKKRLLAVHEAGHILLAHMFPRFDWHAFSQLLPGGKETAMSVFYPREDMVGQGYTTFGYMKMQMVVAHGGRCAERIVFGDEVTDGGSGDLRKITRIAREMAISPKNTRLGLYSLVKRHGRSKRRENPDGKMIKFTWDDPHVIPVDMTTEVSELFIRELTRYIEETEELAMTCLKKNRHILDLIANELLEKSRITGMEVEEKLKGVPVSMFEDFAEPFQINLEEDETLPFNDQVRYKPLDVYPAPLHRC